jgi:hypothetical protein
MIIVPRRDCDCAEPTQIGDITRIAGDWWQEYCRIDYNYVPLNTDCCQCINIRQLCIHFQQITNRSKSNVQMMPVVQKVHGVHKISQDHSYHQYQTKWKLKSVKSYSFLSSVSNMAKNGPDLIIR